MNDKLTAIRKELRSYLSGLYASRLDHIILYGSQAREDAEPGSDIDVLVILKGALNPYEESARTSAVIADMSLRYGEVISCLFVSAERFYTEQSPLLLNVRKEGVAL